MPKRKCDEGEQCLACTERDVCVAQQECGHCILCATCAFRVFNEERRCPSCRTAMLLPLVSKEDLDTSETLTASVARRAILDGEEAVGKFTGNGKGVKQALLAIFGRVPPELHQRWFIALEKASNAAGERSVETVATMLIEISLPERHQAAALDYLARRPGGSVTVLLDALQKAPAGLSERGEQVLQRMSDTKQGNAAINQACVKLSSATVDPAAIVGIVSTMRVYRRVGSVQERGLESLRNYLRDSCAANNKASHIAIACSAGGVDVAVAALSAYPDSAGVQASGLSLLRVIADDDVQRTRRVALSARAGVAAVTALRTHPWDMSVRRAALRCLKIPNFTPSRRATLLAAGAVEELAAALARCTLRNDRSDALWALRHLLAPTCPSVTGELARLLLKPVADAMRAHAEDGTFIQGNGARVIEALACHKGVTSAHLVEAGAVEALIVALTRVKEPELDSAASAVCSALITLVKLPPPPLVLGDGGGTPVTMKERVAAAGAVALVQAVREAHASVADSAERLFTALGAAVEDPVVVPMAPTGGAAAGAGGGGGNAAPLQAASGAGGRGVPGPARLTRSQAAAAAAAAAGPPAGSPRRRVVLRILGTPP